LFGRHFVAQHGRREFGRFATCSQACLPLQAEEPNHTCERQTTSSKNVCSHGNSEGKRNGKAPPRSVSQYPSHAASSRGQCNVSICRRGICHVSWSRRGKQLHARPIPDPSRNWQAQAEMDAFDSGLPCDDLDRLEEQTSDTPFPTQLVQYYSNSPNEATWHAWSGHPTMNAASPEQDPVDEFNRRTLSDLYPAFLGGLGMPPSQGSNW